MKKAIIFIMAVTLFGCSSDPEPQSIEVEKTEPVAVEIEEEAQQPKQVEEVDAVAEPLNNEPATEEVEIISDEDLFNPIVAEAAPEEIKDKKNEELAKEKQDLDALLQNFSDSVSLAAVTPKKDLPPKISELQAIKRDVQSYNVHNCMDTAKSNLLSYMNVFVDNLLEFQLNSTVGQFKYPESKEKAEQYKKLYEHISNQCVTML